MKKYLGITIFLSITIILTACSMTTEEIDTALMQLNTTYQSGTYDQALTEVKKLDKSSKKMSDEQKSKFDELKSSLEYAISSVQGINDSFNKAQSFYDQKMYYEAQQELDKISQNYKLPPTEQKKFDEKQTAISQAIISWKITENIQKAEAYFNNGDYNSASNTLSEIDVANLTEEQKQKINSLNEKISSAKAETERKKAEAERKKKENAITLQTARAKVAQISGYAYSELLSENNNKWYLAPTENQNDTVRGSGGNVNKGVLVYSVDKTTGEVVREQ